LRRFELGDRGGSHLVGPHELRLNYSLDLLQAVTRDCRNLRHRTICLGEARHSYPAQILAIEMQCPRPACHRIPARGEIALTHRPAAHAAQEGAVCNTGNARLVDCGFEMRLQMLVALDSDTGLCLALDDADLPRS
jgi:hypothetical protein